MTSLLNYMSKEMVVLLVAAMPVMELRGAIPLGISMGVDPIKALIIGMIGSMIPVPFLLVLLEPVFEKLRENDYMKKIVDKIVNRTIKKTSTIHKYKAIGLLLFVAVPIPTTGVWTGAMAASLLKIRFVPALINILIGNTIAALIIAYLSNVVANI
ncbi:COG2426 family protein [Anaeromicrobium sediminis]|uniref:Ligand-binding protein SH3 n=1 Tax=Anaeromicrobium sediminis TaxID=1478221 RepID=A0A267MII0_9FIRM|nr:small multi-drug export protein [Anaeromicrobium sediminis]PAB59379.1 ligand-binding protein SH3 [Anaeromicrobium sediminis]